MQATEIRLRSRAMNGGDTAGNLADPALDQILHFRAEAARSAADVERIGDRIIGRSSVDESDADHRRIERINAAAGNRL